MNKVSKKPTSPRVGASRAKKEQIVARLAEKVSKAKGLVFTNYQGLTHKQLEDLKKKVKAANAELIVTKNTLLKRALLNWKHLSVSDFGFRISDFQGPTATLITYGDPSEPLKQLARSIKEFNLPSVKFGILDKQTITKEQVLRWAALPSREILISQLFLQMKAPIYRLQRALGWNMQKLVITLKAVENLKNQNSNVKSAS